MHIVSYRGPAEKGGVSNALTQIDRNEPQQNDWWFIQDRDLCLKKDGKVSPVYKFDATIHRNHYHYCNNFLWPVFHDMPDLAVYSHVERLHYKVFNSSLALNVRRSEIAKKDAFFINDYQLALMPKFLDGSQTKHIFWHIPWPRQVNPNHVDALIEIADGLLESQALGFHTQEYKENFERFVQNFMPDEIIKTNILVAPLGVDIGFWQSSASVVQDVPINTNGLPYILSIDPADYTKGVKERLEAIECFFSKYPQWLGKVIFIQLGSKTRIGLPEFDNYWRECRNLYRSINANYRSDGWQPVVWLEEPKSQKELSAFYKFASMMLVGPLRDGLNLAAKEFIVCQQDEPGVLALSKGAGVFSELGLHCLNIKPDDPSSFAHTILYGLNMSKEEKLRRLRMLKYCVASNSLKSWWSRFSDWDGSNSKNAGKEHNRICS